MVPEAPQGRQEPLVMVCFAARDGDPYPRNRATGQYLHAETHDPSHWGPTLRALADPRSDLFGRVSDLYYLCHPSVTGLPRQVARSAVEVAPDMQAALCRHVRNGPPPALHVGYSGRLPEDPGLPDL